MSIFDVKHHEGYIFIVVVELFWFVAEFSPYFYDAVKCLVSDHGLKADVKLQECRRMSFVELDMMETSSGARLWHIFKHASVELESLHPEPSCKTELIMN